MEYDASNLHGHSRDIDFRFQGAQGFQYHEILYNPPLTSIIRRARILPSLAFQPIPTQVACSKFASFEIESVGGPFTYTKTRRKFFQRFGMGPLAGWGCTSRGVISRHCPPAIEKRCEAGKTKTIYLFLYCREKIAPTL